MQPLHCSVAPVKVAAVYVPSEYPQHRGTLGDTLHLLHFSLWSSYSAHSIEVLWGYPAVTALFSGSCEVAAMYVPSEYPQHRGTLGVLCSYCIVQWLLLK